MNFSRATFVLLDAALVLMAAVHWKDRTRVQVSSTETQDALSELRGQIESQNQLLAELRLRLAELELHSSVVTPAAIATDAINEPLNLILAMLLAMLPQQSNALAMVQGQLPVIPAESPEQRRLRAEANFVILKERYEEQQHKLKSALDQLDALRVSLGVPDEIATLNDPAPAYDSRLVPYRAFFDARRSYEEAQRFGRILEMKLAAEQFDAPLPVSR